MKTNSNFRKLALLPVFALSLSVFITSCDKDDPAPAPKNIVQLAQGDTSLSLLVAAVTKAGLATTLSTTNNLTVFAPTNNAFRTAGYDAAKISALTPAQVTDILVPLLTYHVVGAKVVATAVPASDTVKTLNGKNLFASRNANGVFLNGVKVKTANLDASNGVVHVIEKVLLPPTQTIAQIVIADARFSLLKQAVITADLATTLGGRGKFTVFAPLNTGFPAALDTDAEIIAAGKDAVAGVVLAHAFGTNIAAGDLVAGDTPSTLKTGTLLTVALSPASVKIKGSANAASNITATDIVATNGIIHIIDKVLQ